jgi:hypothetical protein
MIKRILLLVLIVGTCLSKVFSQLSATLPASNSSVIAGTYVDLGTGGSAITTLNTDDANSAAIPIGFTFNFNGAAYTDFILNTNGFIKLGTDTPSTRSLFFTTSTGRVGGPFNSTSVLDTSLIVAFNHDLIGAIGAEYRSQTTGTVGTRVCTIQFKNVTEKTSTPAVQYANMNFQIKLFEGTDIIQIIYGGFTASVNASAFKTAAVGIKGRDSSTLNIQALIKGSNTAWTSPTFLVGNYTSIGAGNAFNFGNGSRPLPVSGTTYEFVPAVQNDLSVRAIYTLGKIPKTYVTPHFIRAAIKNSGANAQTNKYVKLFVTGANTFVDSVLISQINAGTDTIITFGGFSPSNNGTNTINVLVDNDQNNTNNSKSNTQLCNDVNYSYADPAIPVAGGVGYTNPGVTGDFVAKFPYNGVGNAINQIGVNFFAGGVSLKIGIWARNTLTGLPSTLVWSSAQFTSSAGLNTIPVIPAVSINDTFFVGVIQNIATSASFAYQTENPIRNNTFFNTSPSGSSTWSDFSATGSNFRLMIEPRLQTPNDVGFSRVDYPCKVLPQGQTSFNPTGILSNYGTVTQAGFNVKCAIFNASNAQIYISTTTAPTLTGSQSLPISFPLTFNTNTAGTYTIKIWSELLADSSKLNDTVTSTFIINNIPILGQENRLRFNGRSSYIEMEDKPSIKPGNNFTIETWVLDSNLSSKTGCIFSADSSSVDTSLSIENLNENIRVSLKTANGSFSLTSNKKVPFYNWAHVGVTYSGSLLSLYINGDTAGVIPATGNIIYKQTPVYLGKRSGVKSLDSASVLNGGLDEFRIWNVTRTQTQIIQNMHRKLTNFSEPNLMAYFRMDEGLGNAAIADASGNCNSGNLVNMAPNAIGVGVGQVWFNASVLLDTTTATIFNITNNTLQTSNTHQIGVKAANPIGTGSFAVYSAVQPIIGNVPTGFTNNSTRTWMVYKYGDLTFDSLRVEFGVPSGSILASSTNNDLALNGRLMGFGAWTNTRNSAASFQTVSNNYKVNFLLFNTDSFNKQFVISSNSSSLPVKWIAFNASKENKHIVLKWTTAFELNNKGFEVERSIDGKNFRYVDFVKGNGSSSQLNNYQFTDESTKNATVYYRLKQIDMDGKFDYSSIVSINGDDFGSIELVEVSPNPFDAELQVKVATSSDKAIKLALYNANGKLVMDRNVGASFGSNIIAIEEANTLAKGLYILKVSQNGVTKTLKIVK